MEVYFEYNYLESIFQIYSNQDEVLGEIELHEFHSFVTLYEYSTEWMYRGELLTKEMNKFFTIITNTWTLFNREDAIIGVVKEQHFSLGRSYNYTTNDKMKYLFKSKVFSKNYTVIDERGTLIASARIKYGNIKSKVNLLCHSSQLDLVELITTLTGILILDRKRHI